MNPNLPELIELAKLTGDIGDPRVQAQLRKLASTPDRALEERLRRRLIRTAGNQILMPRPFSEISIPFRRRVTSRR
jgi:hypothetical protein